MTTTEHLNAARELLREIRDNEVNAQDEADKFLRDGVCSELSELKKQIAEKDAHIAALRSAVQHMLDRAPVWLGTPDDVAAQRILQDALSAPPPAVVPLEDVGPLVEALVSLSAHDGPGFPHGTCASIAGDALSIFTAKHPHLTK